MKSYIEHLKNAQEFAEYAQSLMYRDFPGELLSGYYEYHYCESGLYAIRDKRTKVISLVFANSPTNAINKYFGLNRRVDDGRED